MGKDFDEIDDFDLDFDEDFDSGTDMDDSGGDRSPVAKVASMSGSGFISQFDSTERLDTIKDVGANIFGQLSRDPKKGKDFANDLSDLSSSAVKTLKQEGSFIADAADGLPDEGFLGGIKKTLVSFFQERDESTRAIDYDGMAQSAVEAALGAVPKESKEERLRKTRDSLVNLDSNKLLANINTELTFARKTTADVHTKFLRKSLEVQFKSLYVQKELLDLTKASVKGHRDQMEALIRNSSIPDFAKLLPAEMATQIAMQRMTNFGMSKLTSKLGFKDRTKDMLNEKISDALGGLSQLDDLRSMGEDISPYQLAAMGVVSGSRTYASTKMGRLLRGNKLTRGMMTNLDGFLGDKSGFLRNRANKSGEGILSNLYGFGAELFQDELRQDTAIAGPGNYNTAAQFTNEVKVSITRVIPDLLSKIYSAVSGDEEIYYDHREGGFKKRSENLSNGLNGVLLNSGLTKDNTKRIHQLIKRMISSTGIKLDSKEFSQLRGALNKASILNGSPISLKDLTTGEIELDFSSMGVETRSKIQAMLEKFTSGDNGKGLSNTDYFNNAMAGIQTGAMDPRAWVQHQIQMGNADSLIRSGMITRNSNGGYDVNLEKYAGNLNQVSSIITKRAGGFENERDINEYDIRRGDELVAKIDGVLLKLLPNKLLSKLRLIKKGAISLSNKDMATIKAELGALATNMYNTSKDVLVTTQQRVKNAPKVAKAIHDNFIKVANEAGVDITGLGLDKKTLEAVLVAGPDELKKHLDNAKESLNDLIVKKGNEYFANNPGAKTKFDNALAKGFEIKKELGNNFVKIKGITSNINLDKYVGLALQLGEGSLTNPVIKKILDSTHATEFIGIIRARKPELAIKLEQRAGGMDLSRNNLTNPFERIAKQKRDGNYKGSSDGLLTDKQIHNVVKDTIKSLDIFIKGVDTMADKDIVNAISAYRGTILKLRQRVAESFDGGMLSPEAYTGINNSLTTLEKRFESVVTSASAATTNGLKLKTINVSGTDLNPAMRDISKVIQRIQRYQDEFDNLVSKNMFGGLKKKAGDIANKIVAEYSKLDGIIMGGIRTGHMTEEQGNSIKRMVANIMTSNASNISKKKGGVTYDQSLLNGMVIDKSAEKELNLVLDAKMTAKEREDKLLNVLALSIAGDTKVRKGSWLDSLKNNDVTVGPRVQGPKQSNKADNLIENAGGMSMMKKLGLGAVAMMMFGQFASASDEFVSEVKEDDFDFMGKAGSALGSVWDFGTGSNVGHVMLAAIGIKVAKSIAKHMFGIQNPVTSAIMFSVKWAARAAWWSTKTMLMGLFGLGKMLTTNMWAMGKRKWAGRAKGKGFFGGAMNLLRKHKGKLGLAAILGSSMYANASENKEMTGMDRQLGNMFVDTDDNTNMDENSVLDEVTREDSWGSPANLVDTGLTGLELGAAGLSVAGFAKGVYDKGKSKMRSGKLGVISKIGKYLKTMSPLMKTIGSKVLPGAAAVTAAIMAGNDLMNGDYASAGLDVLSGLVSFIPIIGIPLSIGGSILADKMRGEGTSVDTSDVVANYETGSPNEATKKAFAKRSGTGQSSTLQDYLATPTVTKPKKWKVTLNSKKIPKKLKILIEHIAHGEGTSGAAGYKTVYGKSLFLRGKHDLTSIDITKLRIDEVYTFQNHLRENVRWYNKNNKRGKKYTVSHAVGKFQFMQGTLADVIKRVDDVSSGSIFDQNTQDKLGIGLLRLWCKLDKWLNKELSNDEFQTLLSRKWASIPDPATGVSHYKGGDGKPQPTQKNSHVKQLLLELSEMTLDEKVVSSTYDSYNDGLDDIEYTPAAVSAKPLPKHRNTTAFQMGEKLAIDMLSIFGITATKADEISKAETPTSETKPEVNRPSKPKTYTRVKDVVKKFAFGNTVNIGEIERKAQYMTHIVINSTGTDWGGIVTSKQLRDKYRDMGMSYPFHFTIFPTGKIEVGISLAGLTSLGLNRNAGTIDIGVVGGVSKTDGGKGTSGPTVAQVKSLTNLVARLKDLYEINRGNIVSVREFGSDDNGFPSNELLEALRDSTYLPEESLELYNKTKTMGVNNHSEASSSVVATDQGKVTSSSNNSSVDMDRIKMATNQPISRNQPIQVQSPKVNVTTDPELTSLMRTMADAGNRANSSNEAVLKQLAEQNKELIGLLKRGVGNGGPVNRETATVNNGIVPN